jgi:hypothetical protein
MTTATNDAHTIRHDARTIRPAALRRALRRALLLDAAASGAMGALLLVAAGPLESRLGLPASLLYWVGALLIPFAGLLIWIASLAPPPHGVVRAIVGGNALWVVASVLLLASGSVAPTRLGVLFVLAQAAAVALFAYLEHDGQRRAARAGGHD